MNRRQLLLGVAAIAAAPAALAKAAEAFTPEYVADIGDGPAWGLDFAPGPDVARYSRFTFLDGKWWRDDSDDGVNFQRSETGPVIPSAEGTVLLPAGRAGQTVTINSRPSADWPYGDVRFAS